MGVQSVSTRSTWCRLYSFHALSQSLYVHGTCRTLLLHSMHMPSILVWLDSHLWTSYHWPLWRGGCSAMLYSAIWDQPERLVVLERWLPYTVTISDRFHCILLVSHTVICTDGNFNRNIPAIICLICQNRYLFWQIVQIMAFCMF